MCNYPLYLESRSEFGVWGLGFGVWGLGSDKDLFNAMRQSIEYYYSYGQQKCNEIYEDQTADEDMSGWNILACGDQAMPMNQDGVKDMFYP